MSTGRRCPDGTGRSVRRRWTDFVVVTRQAAITLAPAGRRVVSPLRQVTAIAVASVFVGMGAVAFVKAGRGVPPYDVLLLGISERIDVTHGQAGWIVGGALFGVAAALGRRPGPVALGWVIANGLTVDLFTHLLNDADSVAAEVAFMTVGVVAIAAGIAAFVHATDSGGPYELIMAAMGDRGRSRVATRVALDVGVVVAGVALAGPYGLASLLYPFVMGPVLGVTLQGFDDLRRGRESRIGRD